MTNKTVIGLLFVLFGVFCMPSYIRWGTDVFKVHDQLGDGNCLFSSLAVGLGCESTGEELREALAVAITEGTEAYLTLFRVFTILEHKRNKPFDPIRIRNLLLGIKNHLMSFGNEWGTDQDIFIYSLVTGNRVVSLQPTPIGVIDTFDTLQQWQSVVEWGAANNLLLPPSLQSSASLRFVT